MLVAVVALLAALAGGAVGATLVTGEQIKDGSITGKDVKNGSLQLNDLSKLARTSLRAVGVAGQAGPAGPQGPQGPTGPQGPAGLRGSAGVVGAYVRVGEPAHRGSTFATAVVSCDPGDIATGGGYAPNLSFPVANSTPTIDVEGVPHGWQVDATAPSNPLLTFFAYVVCLDTGP
jgi:hypothetical protein